MALYPLGIVVLLLWNLIQINFSKEINISEITSENSLHLNDDLIFPNENHTLYFIFLLSRSFLPANAFEFAVSIRTHKSTKFFGDNHFCTGVIVSTRCIVTAAHCVIDNQGVIMRPYRLQVVAACPNRLRKSRNAMEYRIQKVIPHPQFRRYHGYDIALLFLKRLINANNPKLEIIEIANTTPPIGTRCMIQGWGELYVDGPFADQPVQNFLYIVPSNYCSILPDVTDVICAAHPNLNVYTCRGDSGTPLICNKRLVGIASYANYSSKRQSISFIDVTKHSEWMSEMHRLSSCTSHTPSLLIIMLVIIMHKITSTISKVVQKYLL